jgi:hypothetical protein
MSKHTPAPWVIDDDNRTYVGIAGEFADGHNYAIIAETATHSLIGVREAIANARLIAAAPDMLEALEKLLEYEPSDRSEFRSDPKGDREFQTAKADFASARAAIAKAKGE